jgi:DNA-binding response OmpR family regulator
MCKEEKTPMNSTISTRATIIDFTCAGIHIIISEEGRKLRVNGRSIALTPTEYRLCTAFFQQWHHEKREAIIHSDDMIMLSYCTDSALQHQVSLASRQLLRKHISNANGKLLAYNMQIKAFENGYILLMKPEQEDEYARVDYH